LEYEFRKLSCEDGRDIYDMLQQLPEEENGFLNRARGLSYEEFKAWLRHCEINAQRTEVYDGWKVPQQVFWLYADGVPVGVGKLRPLLTDALRQAGGNAGYSVAPAYRGMGYAKVILQGLLKEARKIGMTQLLITVRNNNPASIRVALSCGGVIDHVNDVRHYIWLDCIRQ